MGLFFFTELLVVKNQTLVLAVRQGDELLLKAGVMRFHIFGKLFQLFPFLLPLLGDHFFSVLKFLFWPFHILWFLKIILLNDQKLF